MRTGENDSNCFPILHERWKAKRFLVFGGFWGSVRLSNAGVDAQFVLQPVPQKRLCNRAHSKHSGAHL